jgi:hypothetical protein
LQLNNLRLSHLIFISVENQNIAVCLGLFIQKNNINQAYFFKDEGQEFVGILAEKAEIINFSYTIHLPKLIDGLGYSNGNYFLHNFYPQLYYLMMVSGILVQTNSIFIPHTEVQILEPESMI